MFNSFGKPYVGQYDEVPTKTPCNCIAYPCDCDGHTYTSPNTIKVPAGGGNQTPPIGIPYDGDDTKPIKQPPFETWPPEPHIEEPYPYIPPPVVVNGGGIKPTKAQIKTNTRNAESLSTFTQRVFGLDKNNTGADLNNYVQGQIKKVVSNMTFPTQQTPVKVNPTPNPAGSLAQSLDPALVAANLPDYQTMLATDAGFMSAIVAYLKAHPYMTVAGVLVLLVGGYLVLAGGKASFREVVSTTRY